MPWVTPTLEQLRSITKGNVQAQLRSGPMIPNSVLRVMADTNTGLAYLVLLYINWLSNQLLADTAEGDFLARHADIWKPGGQGKKNATFASATIQFTAVGIQPMPAGTIMVGASDVATGGEIDFASNITVSIGSTPTNVDITALTAGATGLVIGSQLSLQTGISGISGVGTITAITDGVEEESDDLLRARVLDRIQQPPMGGDAQDYVDWIKATPGVAVTRAWCSPNEMGPGTVSVRFMCDDLINQIVGFPNSTQIAAVQTYLDTVRPVTLKDRFVLAPIPEPINFGISNLSPDTVSIRNAIAQSVAQMLFSKASPAYAINGIEQEATTIYQSWVSEAIMSVAGVETFTLNMTDHVMPYQSSLAVLGSIVYA